MNSTLSSTPLIGSTISVKKTDDAILYEWVATSRHPMQWILTLFGSAMVFAAMTMPVAMLTDKDPSMRPSVLEAVGVSVTLLCSGLTFLYAGLKRRGHEQVVLSKSQVKYDTGPTSLPLQFMFVFGQIFALNSALLGQSGPPVFIVRKRFCFPVSGLGPFVLERVGERQRLRVDHGAERVEIGYLLREPEREWLAVQLQRWQAGLGSDSTTASERV